ncbi:unnamed protein product [Fraxinus pennsylvanica]|uniref:Cytochrome P450 n=1 Tax=Fraxinus pennsylvanica TaxID=56036 RepID=A0AAD2E231_9LAMI|nr:unnamed protein product [Fraxinus pennsylvanica]
MLILKHIEQKISKIPPGPYPWPVIGNVFQMGRNPHIKLASMARIYGQVMSFRLGASLVVVGSSPTAAMEILKTQDRFLSGRYLSYTHPASSPKVNKFAVGFANECDDQWKFLRSICRAELFSGKALQSQMKIREKNVINMVRYLHAKQGQVVNISELIFNTLLNTNCNMLFSMDVFGPDGGGKGMEVKKLVVARQVPFVVATLMHEIVWSLPGYNSPTELNMDEVYHIELLKKEPLQLIPQIKRQL